MAPPAFDWRTALDSLARIAAAYALAMPIGWQREREAHHTGIRTFPIVAVASCAYILVAQRALGEPASNVGRVLQGLMTGIGFVGGGAIVKHGISVRGTATAASIWNVGAIGAAVALGSWDLAVLLAAVNFVTLRYLAPIRKQIRKGGESDDDGSRRGRDSRR